MLARKTNRPLSPEDLRLCREPEKLLHLFRRLGYPVESDTLPIDKARLSLSPKDSAAVRSVHLLADLQGKMQVILLQMQETDRLRLRSIANNFSRRPCYYFFVATDDWKRLIFVNPRRVAGRTKIYKLVVDTTNPTRHDVDILNEICADGRDPEALYRKQCEAFNIETVTTKFYREYKEIFQVVQEHLQKHNRGTAIFFESKQVRRNNKIVTVHPRLQAYAQRLLGRIMFLYFLQRKGWLGGKSTAKADGDLKFLTDQFKRISLNDGNYWQDLLEPLFFDTLNRRRENDDSPWGKIPYLNGGLFERDPQVEPELVYMENALFDPNATDAKGNPTGILGFFNSYDFTIEEDTPLEVDVALDPELLGKVFENMLEEEERESTGTFYTPRPIVHFMCRETLTGFLHYQTGLPTEAIKQLYEVTEEPVVTPEQANCIEAALKTLRVLDPAVGSGAFLVSMLQEIVTIRRACALARGMRVAREGYELASWKKEVIENNLFGVDIKREAVEIAQLRLWLSLIVDTARGQVQPLPNLDYKIMKGDSLVETFHGIDILMGTGEKQGELALSETQQKILHIRDLIHKHYNAEGETQKELERQIRAGEEELVRIFIRERRQNLEELRASVTRKGAVKGWKASKRESKIIKDTIKEEKELDELEEKLVKQEGLPFFLYRFWFGEVFIPSNERKRSGFDIVIGNPPYGLKLADEIRDFYFPNSKYGKQSKDSYGIFYARGLQLCCEGGFLSYITSDTWQTIKSHRPLRRLFLDNVAVQHLLSMPGWVFGQTVNTAIFTACYLPGEKNKAARDNNEMSVADFTRLPSRDNEILEETLAHWNDDSFVPEKNEEEIPVARYRYPQSLIPIYSGIPFFVGSPKLYCLMADTVPTVEKEIGQLKKVRVPVRQVEMNGKVVQLVKHGEISQIKHGLTTGDNKSYLYKEQNARGSYKIVDKTLLLTPEEIKLLNDFERKHGFDERKFGGKYILAYDKGGESESGEGWLPNYYVPTLYFIDWRKDSVDRMKKLVGHRHDNPNFYFKSGITFSRIGVYAPTFRLSASSLFDANGSIIFCELFDVHFLLGVLCSKIVRYLLKVYIDHSVSAQVDDIKEIAIPLNDDEFKSTIIRLVAQVVEKQKVDREYPYWRDEQKKIDDLAYKLFFLSNDDIVEIEAWFARRYPLLAAAQKQ